MFNLGWISLTILPSSLISSSCYISYAYNAVSSTNSSTSLMHVLNRPLMHITKRGGDGRLLGAFPTTSVHVSEEWWLSIPVLCCRKESSRAVPREGSPCRYPERHMEGAPHGRILLWRDPGLQRVFIYNMQKESTRKISSLTSRTQLARTETQPVPLPNASMVNVTFAYRVWLGNEII